MNVAETALTSFLIRRQTITLVEDFWRDSNSVVASVSPLIVKSFTIPEDQHGSHYWVSGFTTVEGAREIADNAYIGDPVAPLSFYDFLGAPYDYSTVQAYKISPLKLTVEEVENAVDGFNRDELLSRMYTLSMSNAGERGKPATLTMLVYETLDSLHNMVMSFVKP